MLFPAITASNLFEQWSAWNQENRNAVISLFIRKEAASTKNPVNQEPSIPTFKSYIGGVPQEFEILRDSLVNEHSAFIRPHGILLEGLPGTGKTYLVKCLAGELGTTIIEISAANLMDMYVGSGPAKIKAEFARARNIAKRTGKPVIVFFDEFDSIGKRIFDDRNSAVADEINKTVNALLAEIDGFNSDDNIIVIAATNKADYIDEAFKRPGRFDYIIRVLLPDAEKRQQILTFYKDFYKISFADDVNLDELSDLTEGFNCADLHQVIKTIYNKMVIAGTSEARHQDLIDIVYAQRKVKGLDSIQLSKIKKNETSRAGFADVVGGVPQEIEDLKAFLQNDASFAAVGAEKPKGILLQGPPGTGKTLLARALANEIDAAFFAASASSFIEVYVGTGPKAVRELFEQARAVIRDGKVKQAIIFIDEIDSIGSRSGGAGNSPEYQKTINELLVQMDGFHQDEHITVIGATNRADMLDSALLRPGRFDWIVTLDLPDLKKRAAIIHHYLYNKPRSVAPTINIVDIAKKTEGFNCAELKDLINRSAIVAVRHNKMVLGIDDIDQALKDILMIKKQYR